MLIGGLTNQEYITIISKYAPNIKAPKYVKQTFTELNIYIENSIIRAGDINRSRSFNNRKNTKKIWQKIRKVHSTTDQVDIIDIYRMLLTLRTEYAFSSSDYGIIFRKFHILHHETSFDKFLKTKI